MKGKESSRNKGKGKLKYRDSKKKNKYWKKKKKEKNKKDKLRGLRGKKVLHNHNLNFNLLSISNQPIRKLSLLTMEVIDRSQAKKMQEKENNHQYPSERKIKF